MAWNYRDHAKELDRPVHRQPVFFMKADSALLLGNKPFFHPDFSDEVHYEAEIVLKICRLGKHIESRYARRYYDEVTVGIDFTARDLQRTCIEEGRPWEVAKSFDQSAAVGKFIRRDRLPDPEGMNFQLDVNGTTVQKGNTSDMIFSFDEIVSHTSKFITLRTGDLIFTGTPPGVGKVRVGDHLVAHLEEHPVLDFRIK
jgi:2-keto-4-pentenoate hydratase/2-oxohepta-3-ene-1,7-dioic acid hydratase in catechol pathway